MTIDQLIGKLKLIKKHHPGKQVHLSIHLRVLDGKYPGRPTHVPVTGAYIDDTVETSDEKGGCKKGLHVVLD